MARLSARFVALSLAFLGTSLWGQTFKLESIYSFAASGGDGKRPVATLTLGPDGNLYGTASEGGGMGAGTIFKVSVSPESQVTILNDFETSTTGKRPIARLINIGDGSLYGVTSQNGTVAGDPVGTVFRLDPFQSNDLSPVFQLRLAAGTFPRNPRSLVAVEPGALHVLGYEPGGLWRVPLDGSPGTVTRNFTGTAAEGSFHEKVILGSDGFLYGSSYAGGDNSTGILFRVKPDGTEFTRLHSCVDATGIRPIGAMVEGPDGNFYGTMSERGKYMKGGQERSSNGVVFRITPTGNYTVLHYITDLRYSEGDLMIATDGYLYGTAKELGKENGVPGNGNGGIFRIKPNGSNYEVLYTFADPTPGSYPQGRTPVGGLVQGADGYLYGTTYGGGDADQGTVFRLKGKLPPPPVNRPPVAVDDYMVSNGEPVTIPVVANDYDADNDTLQVTAIKTAPEFGTATIQPNGTILYTPDDYTNSDTFTYEISDKRGGLSEGTVRIRNIGAGPLIAAGSYNGLFAVEEGTTPKGRFVLTVRNNGAFTGTLFANKKRVPLKGKFEEDGIAKFSANIPKQGKRQMLLFFPAGTPNTVAGALFDQDLWLGEAGQNIPSTALKKTSYTVQIGSDENDVTLPAGYGYGVVSIKPNGAVSMAGKLSDGSKLSWSSTLTRFSDGTSIPIFAEPVKGGVFATFADGTEGIGFDSNARWIRPSAKKGPYSAGFNGVAEIEIVPFTKPEGSEPIMDIVDGLVRLFDGPITTLKSGNFSIDGKKISIETPLKKLKIDRNSGLFSGSIKDGNKAYTFNGSINQGGRYGLGSVFVNGQSGKVLLDEVIE